MGRCGQQASRYWTILYGALGIGLSDEHTGKVLHTATEVYKAAFLI